MTSPTLITLGPDAAAAAAATYQGRGDVRIVVKDTEIAGISVARARTASIASSGSTLGEVRVNGVQRLDLRLLDCSVAGPLEVRRVTEATSAVTLREVAVAGDLRIEGVDAEIVCLTNVVVAGRTWLRRIQSKPSRDATIANCEFRDRVWIEDGFAVAAGPAHREPASPVLDLRQNTFRAAATISDVDVTTGGAVPTALSLRGSAFASSARLRLAVDDGVLDARDLRVEGRAEVAIDGSPQACARLSGSEFLLPVDLRVRAATLDASASVLAGGGALGTDGPVVLSAARLGATTLLRPRAGDRSPPRLLSVEGADVSRLSALAVDLRECRFAGSLGLDAAVIETRDELWPRAGGRRTIRDEDDVRARADDAPDAGLVAAAYRQLRKGRESARDEPGAADFYFGEMEMRRLGSVPRSLERALLTLYCLVSGYGLRGRRALTSLVLTVVAGGLALGAVGLKGGASLGLGLLTATEVATLRSSSEPLTTTGRVISIPLRLLAPLLFIQLVLALRSRIRR